MITFSCILCKKIAVQYIEYFYESWKILTIITELIFNGALRKIYARNEIFRIDYFKQQFVRNKPDCSASSSEVKWCVR